MKRWVNLAVQLAGVAVHAANVATPLFPEDQRVVVMALVAGVQGTVGVLAHHFNPDGTSAKVAWETPAKK